MGMAGLGRLAGGALGLLLGAVVLGGCGSVPSGPSLAPAHATAAAACLGSVGPGWQVAVESDRSDAATLALVSGDSIAVCQTWREANGGGFGNIMTGTGLHPAPSPATLSYVTGGGTGDQASFLVGRVPASARTVSVSVADGFQQPAVLGDGLWLAWLDEPAQPTAIEARDGSGTVVGRLADPAGLQPTDLMLGVR
jgi:hypothetical protein